MCAFFNPVWYYRLLNFQAGDKKLERFLNKLQHTQMKLLNFKNWCNEEVSKSALVWLSKSIFYVKNQRNPFHFLLLTFLSHFIIYINCPIFDTSPLHQFLKFNNFLWVRWFLGKNISNFVPPAWKTPQLVLPYYSSRKQYRTIGRLFRKYFLQNL